MERLTSFCEGIPLWSPCIRYAFDSSNEMLSDLSKQNCRGFVEDLWSEPDIIASLPPSTSVFH